MALDDVTHISQIEREITPHPWAESQFIDSHEKHSCLTMTMRGTVIGYAIYNIIIDDAEILNIAVDSEHQNKGYGRHLLDYMISAVSKNAKRFFLEVRASNANAIYLYEDVGFCSICVRKNYYQTSLKNENAILMAMEL